MKTMTIRDVRQRWPEAERALKLEREIIITRDGKPVARLLPVEDRMAAGKRFDPVEQGCWRDDVFGKGVVIDSLTGLLEDREDRTI
jgi:antitoxin (DNA-binding transcriptional repressor) of toxin-antitoxin stability system